jgi:hypothetical protein
LKQGKVNLDDPATTVALLKLNAVVGLKGFFQGDNLIGLAGFTIYHTFHPSKIA